VHRVERIKYTEVFERLPQRVRAGVLSRLEVAIESSGGSAPLKYSKEDGEMNHHAEVKSQRKNIESIWARDSEEGIEWSEFSVENSRSCGDRRIQ
jgi:hypothetical protein